MLERINLVPQKPLSEQLKKVVPGVLFIILILIVAVVYLQDRFLTTKIAQIVTETAVLQKNKEIADASLAKLGKLAGEVDRLQKQKILLVAEVGKIEAIRSSKRNYSRAINTLAAVLPDSLKCENISFKGRIGIVEGLALHHRDLPQTVNDIQENPVFTNAFLSDVETVTEEPAALLSFRIMVEIE
jgi:Tfp pilus assembly protein PilN